MTKHTMTPALSDEDYEKKLTVLALAQVQAQLEAGTASSQTLAHYLKLANTKHDIEVKKLELDCLLVEAKIAREKSGKEIEDQVKEVLAALTTYSYTPPENL